VKPYNDLPRQLLRLARLILSKARYTRRRDGTGGIIWSSKTWPKLVVVLDASGKWRLYKIASKRKVKKSVESLLTRRSDLIELSNSLELPDWGSPDERLLRNAEQDWVLEMAIEDAIMHLNSKVPNWVRFRMDSEMLNPQKAPGKYVVESVRDYDLPGLYKALVGKEKVHPSVFKEMFGEVNIEDVPGVQVIKHGPWKVQFMDERAAKAADPTTVQALLDQAQKAVQSKGLGNLAYGDVIIVNTLKGSKRLADYEENNDLVRLRAKSMKGINLDMVRSLLHELGHRNWVKRLGGKKADVKTMYFQKSIGAGRGTTASPGDVIDDRRTGDRYEVEGRDRRGNYVVKLLKSPSQPKQVGKVFALKPKILSTGDITISGKPKDEDTSSYFPTIYSLQSPEEMYCELFADWALGRLKEPAKSWMEELH